MTSTFTYKGTAEVRGLSTSTIVHGTNPVVTQTTPNPFASAIIIWDNPNTVPPSILALTPTSFADSLSSGILSLSGLSRIEVSYVLYGEAAIGGRYYFGQNGTNQVTITGRTGTYQNSFPMYAPGSTPSGLNSLIPWGSKTSIPIQSNIGLPTSVSFSNGFPANGTNDYPDSYNVQFSIRLRFTAVIRCDESNLQSPICLDLCTGSSDARTKCANAYVDYCTKNNLANLRAPSPPGQTQNICEAFIEDYISSNPTTAIDTPLNNYCSKFSSLDDLVQQGTTQDQQLCGCHLKDTIYQDFAKQLGLQYPNLAALYANATKCALPICVNSRYPSLEVAPGKCKAPLCFNSIIIDAEGQIEGNVTNNQTCNVDGGGGGTNYVPLLIGLFVIFIIIMIALYVAYSK